MSSQHLKDRASQTINVCSRINGYNNLVGYPYSYLWDLPPEPDNCELPLWLHALYEIRPIINCLDIRRNSRPQQGFRRLLDFLSRPLMKFITLERESISQGHESERTDEDLRWIEIYRQAIQMFVDEFNGIELIVTHLISGNLELGRLCLQALTQLCMIDSKISNLLSKRNELLVFCFHALVDLELHVQSSKLLELLLLCNSKPMDLSSVPHFETVLERMTVGQVGNFCKILSVTVADLDSKPNLLSRRKETAKDDISTIRESNQVTCNTRNNQKQKHS